MVLATKVAPPIAVMALIWFLSSQPHLGTDLGWIDTVLRKGAHMAVFGVLWLLWARAVGPWPALAITFAWAVTDEIHQTYVDGRRGHPTDVGFDVTGVALAAAARAALLSRRSRT